MFWLTATGTESYDWQLRFAELAFNTDYLLPDDDISSPENDARRARHFCHYPTQHADALLILDNVEDPDMVVSALPALAGREAACTVLYTSRKQSSPGGVTLHTVERLPKEAA